MPTNEMKHIPVMTGIRFIAALMIFLFHYGGGLNDPGSLYRQLFLGVHVFFVLSGFIICYTYYDQVTLSRKFLGSYFVKRFARIYPLFFVLTTLTFIVIFKNYAESSTWLKEYLLNISFLKGFSENYFLSGIGPTWSLTVEETFYFLAPFIFFVISNKKILFPQILFLWAVGALLVVIFSSTPFDGFFADAQFVAFVTFFGRCFEFYCGIWLALRLKEAKGFQGLKTNWRFPIFTVVGLAGMIAIIFLLALVGSYYSQPSVETLPGILLSNILFPVAVTVFFMGLLIEQTWVNRFLQSPLMQLLGKSSYALFLVHTGIIAVAIQKNISNNIIVLFVLLQLLSILLFKGFEFPVNRWIRKKFLSSSNEQRRSS